MSNFFMSWTGSDEEKEYLACDGMVRALARKYAGNNAALFEELYFAGMSGVSAARAHYDAEYSDAAFTTYAYNYIRGAIISAYWESKNIVHTPKGKNGCSSFYDTFSDLNHESEEEGFNYESTIADEDSCSGFEETRQTLDDERVLDEYTGKTRTVLAMLRGHVDGYDKAYDVEAVAATLGISVNAVYKIVSRAKKSSK